MWESSRRRRPRQVASAKACTHQMWHVRIWQTTSAIGIENQPRLARISRGVCASTGRQRSWHARIGQQQATSAKACTKNRGVCASDVGRPISDVACTQRAADAGRGLHTTISRRWTYRLPLSSLACTHRLDDVGRGLPTSFVSCTHWSVDI